MNEVQELKAIIERQKAEIAKLKRGHTVLDHYFPDDEVVGYGHFHIEKMSDGEFWIGLGDHSFTITASKSVLTLISSTFPNDRKTDKP